MRLDHITSSFFELGYVSNDTTLSNTLDTNLAYDTSRRRQQTSLRPQLIRNTERESVRVLPDKIR